MLNRLEKLEKNLWNELKSIEMNDGWNVKRTRLDDFNRSDGFYIFTFRLTYDGADLSKTIATMPVLYHNMPASKTYMLKLLTDRIPIRDQTSRSHLDMAQKIWCRSQTKSIKKIEKHFNLAHPIFNPIGFVYSGRGGTVWEMLIPIQGIGNLKGLI
jgi:hypothetical protein